MSAGVEPCRKNLTSPALLSTRIYGTFYDEILRRSAVMLNSDNYFAINIKKSETARRDICRGLSLAENPFRLLMIAISCIADMSGDGMFYSSCQQALENVYGAGRTARNALARQETPCTTWSGSHRTECPRTTGNSLQDMEQVTHTCSFPIPRARARVCEARQLVIIVPCGVPSPF